MKEKPIRVLVLEDDPGRIQLLEEAFSEIDELRFAHRFGRRWERTYALDGGEALARLEGAAYDVVLVSLETCGAAAPALYFRLRSAAPATPVILLAPESEEGAAMGLVRQGAQDYLLMSELDCAPLERAVRTAIERQRLWSAYRALMPVDELTGLWNREGFAELAERDLALASRFGLMPWLGVVEDEHAEAGLDLRTIEVADHLRNAAAGHDLLGRFGVNRYGILAMTTGPTAAATCAERLDGACRPLAGLRWEAAAGEAALERLERELNHAAHGAPEFAPSLATAEAT